MSDLRREKIVAPCGIDCFNCELFEGHVDPAVQERLAGVFKVSVEAISCKGCTEGHQCLLLDLQGKKCNTLTCVKEKGVDYCFECDSFPCDHLMPLADGADKFPQNIKLYNLCQMKKMGVEKWTEVALENRKRYFSHKIVIGNGGSDKPLENR